MSCSFRGLATRSGATRKSPASPRVRSRKLRPYVCWILSTRSDEQTSASAGKLQADADEQGDIVDTQEWIRSGANPAEAPTRSPVAFRARPGSDPRSPNSRNFARERSCGHPGQTTQTVRREEIAIDLNHSRPFGKQSMVEPHAWSSRNDTPTSSTVAPEIGSALVDARTRPASSCRTSTVRGALRQADGVRGSGPCSSSIRALFARVSDEVCVCWRGPLACAVHLDGTSHGARAVPSTWCGKEPALQSVGHRRRTQHALFRGDHSEDRRGGKVPSKKVCVARGAARVVGPFHRRHSLRGVRPLSHARSSAVAWPRHLGRRLEARDVSARPKCLVPRVEWTDWDQLSTRCRRRGSLPTENAM